MAKDRISCYAQYTSIPAFMFKWTLEGEKPYENELRNGVIGLHMSESPSGKLWKEFPNLLPESSWKRLSEPQYVNEREKVLADRAKDLFARAYKLNIAVGTMRADGSNVVDYTISTLPESLRPKISVFRELDTALGENKINIQAAIDERVAQCAQELFDKVDSWLDVDSILPALKQNGVTFNSADMMSTSRVITPGTDIAGAELDQWYRDIAARLLRKIPDTMNELRGTVLVMELLTQMVEEVRNKKTAIEYFAKYLAANLFTYNEGYRQWEYENELGTQTLYEMKLDNVQKTVEYYSMYEAMRKNFDAVKNALEPKFVEATTGVDRPTTIAKQEAFNAAVDDLRTKVEQRINDKSNPDQSKIISSAKFAQVAAKNGYPVEEIRRFYYDLSVELS
jgi:hypothetical protein